MSVYKKFTPQDYSIIPFNAHKQYNYTSASAASNSINYYNSKWTSESISRYSSASSAYGGDTINNIKYNQIDNLFYRNFNKINSSIISPTKNILFFIINIKKKFLIILSAFITFSIFSNTSF